MILRYGSIGTEVSKLQNFLNIEPDGVFGGETEKAVKEWQRENGLLDDGVVGPLTWDAMGIATTDAQEMVYETENGLIINRHYLPKGEYKNEITKKEYLYLHHTAGWNNPFKTIDDWGRDSRGAIATEFVIGGQSIRGDDDKYDGVVAQAFPEGCYAWHLGPNGNHKMHTDSVGIEICNFGFLNNGKTYSGIVAAESQKAILDTPYYGFKEWHKYSDEQLKNLKLLILHIANRDNIDVRKGVIEWIKKDIKKAFMKIDDAYMGRVKGMWMHNNNSYPNKSDLFPQAELIDMLLTL
jgi:hypothetical protein